MPLDGNMHQDDTVEKLVWQLRFAWLPKRCIYDGGIIWLKNAYYASYHTRGNPPGYFPKSRTVHIWMRKESFVLESLKGRL